MTVPATWAARLDDRIPVVVVTGFLGSGKTTLVNRLLQAPHGLRLAVLVNDFGDINIDGSLIRASNGQVLELSNGCLCCAVRGELLASLEQLAAGKSGTDAQQAGDSFDAVLVETSGLAHPAPVVATVTAPAVERRFRLDCVVTLVDALHFPRWLAESQVARAQVEWADLVVLNKCDLVDEAALQRLEQEVRAVSARAVVWRAVQADVPVEVVLGVVPGGTGRPGQAGVAGGRARGGGAPPKAHGEHHIDHPEAREFVAAGFRLKGAVDSRRFEEFVMNLPEEVIRGKGWLHVRGLRRRVIFHLVGRTLNLEQGSPWEDGDSRESCMVFIGRALRRELLESQLARCVLAEAGGGPEAEAAQAGSRG